MNSQRRAATGTHGLGQRAYGTGLALGCAVLLAGCGHVGDSAVSAARAPEGVAASLTPDVPSLTPDVLSAVPAAPRAESSHLRLTPVAFAETSEDSSGTKGITFDDIKFEMKKDEKFKQRMLTEKINGLFDKTVRIRGYILPPFKQTGLTQFVLVRDNMECCFGKGAALYDCVIVQMVEGHTADYSARPVTVEGKFTFQKLEDPIDGKFVAIYHLDGVSVK